MKASKFTEAQKAFILKQGEEGTAVMSGEPRLRRGRGQVSFLHAPTLPLPLLQNKP